MSGMRSRAFLALPAEVFQRCVSFLSGMDTHDVMKSPSISCIFKFCDCHGVSDWNQEMIDSEDASLRMEITASPRGLSSEDSGISE
jgi:hypothetical protein